MKTSIQNLWNLEKDTSIKALLIMLQHEVGPDSFALLDNELLNEKAVRVVNPKTQRELSAYVYTYAQREGRYGLDIEFPYLIETRADDQTIRMNDLSDVEAMTKIVDHLELKTLQKNTDKSV